MSKHERETSVAEVNFADEPDAKRAAVATEEGTPIKGGLARHPLKNIERGNSVLNLCTYKGAFRRFAVVGRAASRRASSRLATRRRAIPTFARLALCTHPSRRVRLARFRVFSDASSPRPRSTRRARPARRRRRANANRIFPTRSLTAPVHPAAGDFCPKSLEHEPQGEKKTTEFRIKFSHKTKKISPWHDIPYRASPDTFHMMCEIPKWTRAKYEIATKEPGNPIKQDEKKGVLREYKHGDMLFNYGFMPQTWEDPDHVSADTGFKGDDDPLDMVEIGCRQMKTGQVAEVKVLGVLAMIDDGETDWKVFCIRVDDPLAGCINDVEDIDRELPGLIDTMREWFREYKIAEGKPLNKFALDEKCMDREYTERVIEETHGFWKAAEEKLRKLSGDEVTTAAAEN